MHVKIGKRNNVGIPRRLIAAVLCLCTVLSAMSLFRFIPSVEAAAGSPTAGVTRQADPSTMDTYKQMLDFSSNTRYAGRLWSDKTVFALGDQVDSNDPDWNGSVLTLDMADDCVSRSITLDEDFLHVYSVLGSSQNINTENVRPLDVVLLLDISTSMTENSNTDPLHQVITDANELIDTVLNVTGDLAIHSDNRVGVVVYGGGSQVLMPLDHYTKVGAQNFLQVARETDFGHYFPQITAIGNPKSGAQLNKTSQYMLADSTYLQAALYQGMYMLATATGTTVMEDGKTVSRQPILIVLTDGATNIVGATTTGNAHYGTYNEGFYQGDNINWWDPLAWADNQTINESVSYNGRGTEKAQINNYTMHKTTDVVVPRLNNHWSFNTTALPNGNPFYVVESDASTLTTIEPRTVANLLTAGYMKKWIEDNYTTANGGEHVSLTGFGIGLNIDSYDEHGTTAQQQQWAQLYGTMDPRNYIINRSETSGATGQLKSAYDTLARYVANQEPVCTFNNGYWWNGDTLSASWTFHHPTGNNADSTAGDQKYDVTSIDDVYYIDQFYNARTDDISDIFDEILEQITTNIFSPVAGENDLGVENSVTYMDPVGKYMDVKDVKKLVLFGETYDITETAVYDYQWNDDYMAVNGGRGNEFTPGWYLGEPENPQFGGSGSVPTGYSTAEDAWAAGWVYRLNAETAAQFVPTLKDIETVGDAGAKQRATEYTFYRIAEKDSVRKALHMNPAYLAKGQTEEQALAGKSYNDDGSHRNTPGVYALADLRIWVEDTGDYSDPSTGGTETDNNFDEALWINIPVNMLPLRKITINEDAEGNFTYETNLGSPASFPLRVFYTVGVSDEALENGRVNIAGAISPEYISQNKITTAAAESARNIPQGNLEFFSNWYSPLNRYSDYVTTSTDYTYGDPVTSFSPSADNRYYAFEKALPLYNTAYVWVPTVSGGGPNATYTQTEGNWRRVTINEDGTEEETANFTPADFGGKLIAQDLEPTVEQTTPQQRQDGIWKALGDEGISRVHEGDMILLKNHLLTDVTKAEPDPFSSDAYYFLPIEYYELSGSGNTATKVQYLITRKGSEFGSAYVSSKITNGDMLCWHDITGKDPENYPYLSYSETGNESRGRDYIGTTIDPATGWYQDVTKGQAPRSKTYEEWMRTHSDSVYVVCAKPGGLRVGNLAQSVQAKTGNYVTPADMDEYVKDRFKDTPSAESLGWGYYEQNVTRTANNYYLPTISSSSGGDASSAVVNVYLGNNGRLYLPDTTLLVTKLIDPLEGGDVDDTQEFNYQVYIAGVTGTVDAVVVHYNENVGAWQRQFHYIDLELDQQLFLQTQDGQKAMVDAAGKQVIAGSNGGYVYADTGDSYSGTRYYVYIGNNRASSGDIGATGTGFRVYHNNDVDGNGSVDRGDVTIDGTSGNEGTFKAAQVWLVSTDMYTSNWDGQEVTSVEGNYSSILSNFELLTIDPNASDDTTEISITTPYLTASSYWTKQVTFGQNANKDDGSTPSGALGVDDLYDPIIPSSDRSDYFGSTVTKEYIAAHTAEFTLKHGEALLFSGIPSASVYRVTEKLTDAQLEAGYTLKEVSHNQQVGSVSTYRPGSQLLPVYYKDGYTYREYGGGAYPSEYDSDTTEKGLMWALSKSGASNDSTYLHYEPFFHTNAMVWEAYSTMDVDAQGDNHHQPSDVKDGVSAFWLWNETTQTSDRIATGVNTFLSHTVQDNPSCKPLSEGGCDLDIGGGKVLHYFFKDGAMRDFHYEGEGSGYIRNVGRFITSPTVHFLVEGETQDMANLPAQDTKSNTDYVGVYSVFGNTGTFEESVNFVNTIKNDKTETQINGEDVTASDEDRNTYPAVKVGDEITYEIKWANTTSSEAQVVIIDPLDEGVDFVEASDGGKFFEDRAEANDFLATIYTDPKNVVTVDSGHVVIWDLGKQPTGENGTVTLKVKVNEKAPEWWDYDGDGVADKPVDTPEGDYLVRNRATVRVADNAYNTNTVVNPLNQPSKTETNIEHGSKNPAGPGGNTPVSPDEPNNNLLPSEEDTKLHGPTVFPGDKITYEIEWRNYENKPATISIRDPLDDNVAFVSAEFDPTGFKPAPGGDVSYNPADKQSLVSAIDGDQYTGKAPGYGDDGAVERDAIAYIKADHTVTYNLGVVPAGASGKVTLVVQVLDSATPVGYVDNTAFVTVGQNDEQQTDTIENPTPEEKKTEVTPGDGVMVGVGDTITYQISWQNYKPEDARVVVMDTLDPGVTFESATGGEYKYYEKEDILPADGEYEEVKIPAHTVVWTLGVREGLEKGEVTLTVTVNEEAFRKYEYKDTADGFTPDAPSDELDYEVLNQARVKVDNDAFLLTQIVENPIPDKDETNVNHDSSIGGEEDDPELTPKEGADQTVTGPLVYVGDVITYTIHWTNGHNEAANVIIRDPLDPGVDFVEASFDTVKLTDAEDSITQDKVRISYDEATHTVTWILEDRAAKESDIVTLKVRVNEKATPVGFVDNQASVKVGTDPFVETKIIENPTPHMEKTEVHPGEGMQVMPGDKIDYKISWHNYEEGEADVIITDKLDPGVDFLSAGVNGNTLTNGETTMKPVTGNLTIMLSGGTGADPTEDITFTLTLKAPEGETLGTEYEWENSEGATGNWSESSKTFTLKPGQQITIKDLPVGTVYSLTANDQEIVKDAKLGTYGSAVTVTVTKEIRTLSELPTEPSTEPSTEEPTEPTVTPPAETNGPTESSPEETTGPTETPPEEPTDDGPAADEPTDDEPSTDEPQEISSVGVPIIDKPQAMRDEDEPTTGDATDPTDPVPGDATEPTDPALGEQDGDEVPSGTEPAPEPPERETDVVYSFSVEVHDYDAPTGGSHGAMPIAESAGFDKEKETYNGEDAAIHQIFTETSGKKVDIYYFAKAHVVVWVLHERPANAEGDVDLTVQVNADAEKFWSYDHPEYGPDETTRDDRVRNQAGVQVGNNPEIKTRIIENPTEPEKTETHVNDRDVSRDLVADEDGYIGPQVNVGDTITYKITWQNNASDDSGQPAEAEITITDVLDPGVEFVDASEPWTYDPDTHTVTWELGKKDPRDRGVVTLTVRVLSSALDGENTVENQATVTVGNNSTVTKWVENPVAEYGGLTVTKTVKGNQGDQEKLWHFTVTLSDTTLYGDYGEMTFNAGIAEFTLKHGESLTATGLPARITYTVEEAEANEDDYTTSSEGETGTIPAGDTAKAEFVNSKSTGPDPHKTEVTPGDRSLVEVGDEITYEITWQNYDPETANVVIRDPLDDGVDFVSASEGYTYDPSTRTVTWTFKADPNTDGVVSLTVQVNENAKVKGIVKNQAFVTVGNHPEVETEIPENPLPGGLIVTKVVTGAAGDTQKEWHFRVELSDKTINGQYGGMFFTDGVAEFTLKHGQSMSATRLPDGVTYTVTELEANQDGYTTRSTGAEGTIREGRFAEARFVNDKDRTPPPPTTPTGSTTPTTPDDTPKTGDSGNLGLWLMLLIVSLAGAAVTFVAQSRIGQKARVRDRRRK